jgi:hypothetical protein
MVTEKKPEDWLMEPEFADLVVLDPDGWDRKNFTESWAEPITQDEFVKRVLRSTCIFKKLPQVPLGLIESTSASRDPETD